MSLSVPVLLMGFNRPELMSIVLDRIRAAKPERLYIAVDGPRAGRASDDDRVQACRDLAAAVDWECRVETLFQERNRGCGQGVSEAITWFFDHEEEGIILEDDIVVAHSFFPFCAELLERYRNDDRVFAISGCNYVPYAAQTRSDQPYRFSRIPHVWGWATWRRSWAQYRLDVADWRTRMPVNRLWRDVDHSVPGTAYWASTFTLLGHRQVDTWDVQLVLAALQAGQLTATSNVNLVQNIGFGPQATHTIVDRDELQPVGEARLPLSDVPVVVDRLADAWTRRHHYRATWLGLMGQAARYLKATLRRES